LISLHNVVVPRASSRFGIRPSILARPGKGCRDMAQMWTDCGQEVTRDLVAPEIVESHRRPDWPRLSIGAAVLACTFVGRESCCLEGMRTWGLSSRRLFCRLKGWKSTLSCRLLALRALCGWRCPSTEPSR
jgi:hypothetical protein